MDAFDSRPSDRTDREAGGPSRRPARRAGLRVEGLESRALLSGMISDIAALPAGVSAGPMAVAADGRLWFAQTPATGSPTLGRVAASGATSTVALPAWTAAVGGLTADPAGNVWFTATNTPPPESAAPASGLDVSPAQLSAVGRVAADGTLKEYAVGGPLDRPGALTLGPDGNVWVALDRAGQAPALARVAPDGTSTTFPVPAGPALGSLAAGPGGMVWFTQGNKIGSMTPAGVVTEFPVTTTAGTPVNLANAQLTAGPDGNLWFLGLGGVSRMTPTGDVKTFVTPGVTPTSLGTATDGNLWYSFLPAGDPADGAVLARMSTDGQTTLMPDRTGPPNLPVVRMAAGHDGALWLEEGGSAFGRLNLASVPALTPPIIKPTTHGYPTLNPGQTYSGSIVSFVPNKLNSTTPSYTATIDWGDGHVTPGVVRPNAAGSFDVLGANTYNVPAGSWQSVSVTVTDDTGASAVIFNRVEITTPNPWRPYAMNQPRATVTTPVQAVPGTPAPAGTITPVITVPRSDSPVATTLTAVATVATSSPSTSTTSTPSTPTATASNSTPPATPAATTSAPVSPTTTPAATTTGTPTTTPTASTTPVATPTYSVTPTAPVVPPVSTPVMRPVALPVLRPAAARAAAVRAAMQARANAAHGHVHIMPVGYPRGPMVRSLAVRQARAVRR